MLERYPHGNVQAAKSDFNHIGMRMENILVQQLGIARRGTLSMKSTTITAEAACGFHKDLQMGATEAIVQYESKTDPKLEISIVTLAPQQAETPHFTAEPQSDVDCENILRNLSPVGLVQHNPELRLKKQPYALWYPIDNIAKEELHMLTVGTLAEFGQTTVIINHSNPVWIPKIRVVSQMEPVLPLICRGSAVATQFHDMRFKALRVDAQDFLGKGTCVLSEIITLHGTSLTLHLHVSNLVHDGVQYMGTLTVHADATVASRKVVDVKM
ncbi:uncharacterized protein [Aristolochia californica]|uniref:uncharacterized protein n=1 Tax=Aristolochia californica TaxID=171875 RepID=UPI0035D9FEF4